MKSDSQQNGNALIWVLIGVALIVIGVLFYMAGNDDQMAENGNGNNSGDTNIVDTSHWEMYANDTYGFSLSFPPDWEVYEDMNHPLYDLVNIYKPGSTSAEPPYTHHSDGTHVSVFPEGIPTEGFFGETVSSTIDYRVAVENARDYVLSDGIRFASYAGLTSLPSDVWRPSAFLFSHTNIADLETECFSNGERVSQEQCDVLTGDTLVRRGSINENDRAMQVAILESFRYIDQSTSSNSGEIITHRDQIRVTQPSARETISSPLSIRGEARGTWFFEASFPVRLLNANGTEIPIEPSFIMTDAEWMTEEYVPFEGTISFTAPSTDTGTLILMRSNPSGLSENADEVRIPVRFAR